MRIKAHFQLSIFPSSIVEEIASLVKDLVNVEFMLENRLDAIRNMSRGQFSGSSEVADC